jgi:hypothetical protein
MMDFGGASATMGSPIVGQLLDTSVPEAMVLDNLVHMERATRRVVLWVAVLAPHAGCVGQPG